LWKKNGKDAEKQAQKRQAGPQLGRSFAERAVKKNLVICPEVFTL